MKTTTRRNFLKASSAAAAAIGLNPWRPAWAQSPAASRPNIVMLFSDEYDFRFTGLFGGKALTPNLDRIAREGARFTQAYCVSSVCNPSRFTALTGLYPSHCRTQYIKDYLARKDGNFSAGFVCGVDRDTPCVARTLSADGYFTGFAGKWGIQGDPEVTRAAGGDDMPRHIDPTTPEGERELIADQDRLRRIVRESAGFDWAESIFQGNIGFKHPLLHHHHIEWITQGALDFIDTAARGDQPFYLHLCPTTVHGPSHLEDIDADPTYTPGGKSTRHLSAHPPRASIRERLKAAGVPETEESVGMLFLDDQIAAIDQKLNELGIADNTLFLVVPDHNTEPGKATVYQQGCHVPVVARWPGHIQPGTVFDQRVSYVDLAPSVLDAAQCRTPYSADGLSFIPALTQGETMDREFLYCEVYLARAIIEGTYKYIGWRPTPSMLERMKNGQAKMAMDYTGNERGLHSDIAIRYMPNYFDPDQLYDLETDPWEQNNLASRPEQKERVERMRNKLVAYSQPFDRPFDATLDPFLHSEEYRKLVARRRARCAKKKWWNEDFAFPETAP